MYKLHLWKPHFVIWLICKDRQLYENLWSLVLKGKFDEVLNKEKPSSISKNYKSDEMHLTNDFKLKIRYC